ncbi:MAG: ammonia monooxygenase [Nocardioides sp.]|nr:ammonia monooxygenase [Nocardioides sp.]
MKHWSAVLVAALAASAALSWLGLPTPFLFGGLVGALAYALLVPGTPLRVPSPAFKGGQAVVGVLVGVSVDWGSLTALGADWFVVVAVSLFSLVVSILVGQLLVRVGATRVTATFASIAGGAAGLTALSKDLGADDRVVAVLQYLRLLVVLVTMPVVVLGWFGARVDAVVLDADADRLWVDALYCALAVGLGLLLGPRLRLPASAIMGPLLVAALLTAVPPFDEAQVPALVAAVGYLAIGVHVGLKFTVASLVAIGRMVPFALLTIGVTLVACAGLGVLLAATTDQTPLEAYLATTPGGIYAVLGTAAATGSDVTFVTAAQVLRLMIVLGSAPFVAAYLRRFEEPREDPASA